LGLGVKAQAAEGLEREREEKRRGVVGRKVFFVYIFYNLVVQGHRMTTCKIKRLHTILAIHLLFS
jgi:hypothetical protein